MNALPQLLEEVAIVSARTRQAKESAREKCVSAIRRLELALVEALDGESLRNLPNLAYPSDRFFALRVRSTSTDPLDRDALVLLPSGMLAMAGRPPHYVREEALDDSELLAEDVEFVAATVERALTLHLDGAEERVARSTARFERLERLAERLHAVVDSVDLPSPSVLKE
jgi:hypothetical protein